MKTTVENLTYSYNGHPVVNGVSLSPREGEVTAVLGPNGAKTTALYGANGALRPAGAARLRTADGRMPPGKAGVAVPQADWSSGLPCLKPCSWPLFRGFGRSPPRARANEMRRGNRPGRLAAFCDARHALSGGELQRVLVAGRCAVPGLLLVNRQYLDIPHQVDILEPSAAGRERAWTVLCVLHDLNRRRFAHVWRS